MINYYLISFGIYLWLIIGMFSGYLVVRNEKRTDRLDVFMIFILCPLGGIFTFVMVGLYEIMTNNDFFINVK